MASKKKDVDWVRLEADYRANIKSMRMMAAEYGISKARIGQVAEENGWVRDTSGKIKAATQAKLDASLLDTKLDAKKPSEREIVEVAAETQKNVILGHRADIGRLSSFCEGLADELAVMALSPDEIHNLAVLKAGDVPDEGEVDKAAAAIAKMLGLPGRVDTFKKLVESKKVLIGLQREAFGIESKHDLEDLTRARNLEIAFVAARA